MIRQPLEAGRQLHSQLVHTLQMAQLLHRAGYVGNHRIRQPPLRETFRSPKVRDQRLALRLHLPRRVHRDGPIHHQFGPRHPHRQGPGDQSGPHTCAQDHRCEICSNRHALIPQPSRTRAKKCLSAVKALSSLTISCPSPISRFLSFVPFVSFCAVPVGSPLTTLRTPKKCLTDYQQLTKAESEIFQAISMETSPENGTSKRLEGKSRSWRIINGDKRINESYEIYQEPDRDRSQPLRPRRAAAQRGRGGKEGSQNQALHPGDLPQIGRASCRERV